MTSHSVTNSDMDANAKRMESLAKSINHTSVDSFREEKRASIASLQSTLNTFGQRITDMEDGLNEFDERMNDVEQCQASHRKCYVERQD